MHFSNKQQTLVTLNTFLKCETCGVTS